MSTDPQDLPDLASRRLGGAVLLASDESFAEKENLVKPEEPVFVPATFGTRGQVYDGWETRRRRPAPGTDGIDGADWAIVRLGVPGVVRAGVVDTAHFTGNHPVEALLEGTAVDPATPAADLPGAPWRRLAPFVPLSGDHRHVAAVSDEARVTHVRLVIIPDGGVARLRVHGEPMADPRYLDAGPLDLAAVENGGRVVDVSDGYYGAPGNLLLPGPARTTGEGWETRRRRDLSKHDWVLVRLAGEGRVRLAELDTTNFLFNAPGEAALHGVGPDGEEVELLARTALQPDTRHRFLLDPDLPPVTRVRLDAFPDGGMARLRLFGSLTEDGRAAVQERWAGTTP